MAVMIPEVGLQSARVIEFLPAETRDFLRAPQMELTPEIKRQYPHEFIEPKTAAFVTSVPTDRLVAGLIPDLIETLNSLGNPTVYPLENQKKQPYFVQEPEVIFTTANFNEIVENPLMAGAKDIFNLRYNRHPKVVTLVGLDRQEFRAGLAFFADFAKKTQASPYDLAFVGLPETAAKELHSQAKRDPMLGLIRLIQAQARGVDVVAVIGNKEKGEIESLVRFDLAGGHPEIKISDPRNLQEAVRELVLRLMTFWSTTPATSHQRGGPILRKSFAEELMRTSGQRLIEAGRRLGELGFFTDPVVIENLIGRDSPLLKKISGLISRQYSEGCLELYHPDLYLWLTSATGSDHLVDKRKLTPEDLAVVYGIKPDLSGALLPPEGASGSVLPSSEAVEMAGMDLLAGLPRGFFIAKAHGHLGVVSYDNRTVKHLELLEKYQKFPVSCSTLELAQATIEPLKEAVETDPDFYKFDLVVLTQPCHGIWILEKAVKGREPFAKILEALETGEIEVSSQAIPQCPFGWEKRGDRNYLMTS